MVRSAPSYGPQIKSHLSSPPMPSAPRDVAQIRLDNAMRLFEEFVSATVKHADAATLRGLERRFAERLQIQPSYWSQIKGRSRQIGERLARQFEQLCHKPVGWMDQLHAAAAADAAASGVPQDDDERFIVGLVLTYYRRHPQLARARLLELLGEALVSPVDAPAPRMTAVEEEAHALWQQAQAGVSPLKGKRR